MLGIPKRKVIYYNTIKNKDNTINDDRVPKRNLTKEMIKFMEQLYAEGEKQSEDWYSFHIGSVCAEEIARKFNITYKKREE